MFGNQTFDFAPSVVLIISNFKTMTSLPLHQYVSVNWSFLAFVLICPLRLYLCADRPYVYCGLESCTYCWLEVAH